MVENQELLKVLRLVASNDEDVRQHNFETLQDILYSNESSIDEITFLKIWKSMFYHMWMCDKMLNQENLADQMADMVARFKNIKQSFVFVKAFLITIEREWKGVDVLRQDKFLMLIRKILYQSFILLQKHNWQIECVNNFLSILQKSMIDPPEAKAFNCLNESLKYHIIDIYIQELSKAGSTTMLPKSSTNFIQPFIDSLAFEKRREVVKRIVSHIFEYIIDQSPITKELFPDLEDNINNEDPCLKENLDETLDGEKKKEKLVRRRRRFKEKNPEKNIPSLLFDYEEISVRLFRAASAKSCPSWNRKIIYDLVEKFDKLNRGEYPLIEEFAMVKSLKKSQIKMALNDLIEEDAKLTRRPKKKLGKRSGHAKLTTRKRVKC